MPTRIAPDNPLRRMFSGLVEQVFMSDLGICSVEVTTYISDILVDFIHVDHIHRLRTVDGASIRELSRMEADAYVGPESNEKLRAWLIHKHIGDFTLFWTGVYPENLNRRRSGGDAMREYLLQGKRSYGIASELTDSGSCPSAAVLRNLGEQFEYCVHGLHKVREGWEQLRADAGPTKP
ncbi:MAG: hypothetical protein IID33_00170 [Planctomycetes bacterium]|nr:hypothetical protein [Planctomycetota bacterium]